MSKVDVKLISERLRVYINDILHLSINTQELVGIQSYRWGDYRFGIDYSMKTTVIETWYVNYDEWKAILDGLEKIHLV